MYIAHFKSFTYAANNNIQMSTRLITFPHKVECTATKIFSPVFNSSALFPSEVLDYVRGMNLHKELNIDRWKSKSNECSSVRENEIVSLLYPIAVFVRLSEDCQHGWNCFNLQYMTYYIPVRSGLLQCNLLLSRQLSQIRICFNFKGNTWLSAPCELIFIYISGWVTLYMPMTQ